MELAEESLDQMH